MINNLWSENKAKNFWLTQPEFDDMLWQQAVEKALPILQMENLPAKDEGRLLELILGEQQFGQNHWQLSRLRRYYYDVKPFMPRVLIRALRQLTQKRHNHDFKLRWPIDERYPLFRFEILKYMLELSDNYQITTRALWPDAACFAFTLTHDIEDKKGQSFVHKIADMEEKLDFRSSFNFVPEKYPVDMALISELKQRGFEVGIHGLKHDGKLFRSYNEFVKRAQGINRYFREHDVVGFRAPLTHRHPEWMQLLNMEYDLSFFDTDPYEPIPGGTMCIWPFILGHFVELPYTLVQDYTLINVLGETTPQIWIDKVDFIEKYHGMALLNTHPDYLRNDLNWSVYREFLISMKNRGGYWHALPREVAHWWRNREIDAQVCSVFMDGDQLSFGIHS